MRCRVIVTAMRHPPVIFFRLGPFLIGKLFIRRIDENSSESQNVCTRCLGIVIARQVRLAVWHPADS